MACVTGDDTGLVKVWDVSRSLGATVAFSYGEQSRKRGIAAMCWMDNSTTKLVFSMNDGVVSVLDLEERVLMQSKNMRLVAGLPSGLAFVKEKLVMASNDGKILIADESFEGSNIFECNGPVEAFHIHRKFGMFAMGGKDNDLCVYDVSAQNVSVPVFKAKNVRDHVLDVPYPVYVAGACIINPFVFCTTTAYHQVRFYDRRSSERPVQEYQISREIGRRPTTLMQWNCNKFLIGEASGDIHLYDTRRGFASRAKLRGGVGSVRSMTKHPAGHQLLGVAGLDRKARIYHVPTGKLLMTMYAKQKVSSILFDRHLPLADNMGAFSGIANSKQPSKFSTLGDEVWDNMDPVVDDINEGTISL
ncbi:ribosome biogenesis protein NSA1 [Trypanosoma rangeli]|uniref:Ribosome biogenesis protein NSA1 n=1 Tax=Trypanosoma rangeli TaxID=5698 RepID=A0A422NE17_TRYRA|nr:ribosome biogenesis protein NSA1 [Trypanosoma rangeli]RNF03740.1 ribosome biogenesis protein NSA1 [Trypanosoma rangeli]|eukprot:RNF03740.1 ribosome biogenesis protein NSA1 [Trypanosoma rangeli]